jgi:uncharacterized protein (DUF924 family)
MAAYQAVIAFWFDEIEPKRWFGKDAGFDRIVTQRFAALHAQAACCELFAWRQAPQGRLAEILLLDQFSRNIFRDRPQAFAYDELALALAQEAVAQGADKSLSAKQRAFLYMPYMHSESALIHECAVELFKAPGLEDNYRFEIQHKAIIDRFGRYPHRNAILGRESTDEERAFIQSPGSGF